MKKPIPSRLAVITLLTMSFILAVMALPASADSFGFAINLGSSGPPACPPPRVEHPWAAPAPGAVWIAGHWTWDQEHGAWVWFPGYYEYPPVPWATYEPEHHYEHHHDHYWVHGHWRY
jgi:hypothetical protein